MGFDGLLADVLGKESTAEEPSGPALDDAPPAALGPRELHLWYIRKSIETLRIKLALVDDMGERGIQRLGSLSKELREWLSELSELAPPEPDDPAAEEKKWSGAAARARAKIERGVREVEGSATCRKCGAECAACASGHVAVH